MDVEFGRLDIQKSQGVYQERAGEFDTTIQARAHHGQTKTPLPVAKQHIQDQASQEESESQYTLGLNKEFRSGIGLAPQIETTRTTIQDAPTPARNDSGIYLVATLPLLRDRAMMLLALCLTGLCGLAAPDYAQRFRHHQRNVRTRLQAG